MNREIEQKYIRKRGKDVLNTNIIEKATNMFALSIKKWLPISLVLLIILNLCLFWYHENGIVYTSYMIMVYWLLFCFGLTYLQLIQEQSHLDKNVKQLQQYLQTLINSTDHALLVLNQEHQISDCNALFEDLFQVSLTEIKQLSFLEFKKTLALKKGNGNRQKFYQTSIDVAGEQKEILYKFQPIYSEKDGKPIGMIASIWNLSKNKEEEHKLQRQERLAVVGQIAASIVHEIKNPLTTIQGLCQMINEVMKNDKIQRHIQSVDNSIKDLNRIVGDFLKLARLRPPSFQEVQLEKFIELIKPLLESSCFTKGVQLNFQILAEEKRIMIDAIQLKQIILNLVENALDAVAKVKNPMIVIRTGIRRSETKKEVYLAIEDNGEGMSEARKNNLGTPFFTTKEKGTGLGLSLCFQMIRDHQGSIQVESEENKGSTFRILLPIQE